MTWTQGCASWWMGTCLAAMLSAGYRLSRPVGGLPGIRHSRERVPRFSVERCRRAVVNAGADVDAHVPKTGGQSQCIRLDFLKTRGGGLGAWTWSRALLHITLTGYSRPCP